LTRNQVQQEKPQHHPLPPLGVARWVGVGELVQFKGDVYL
jgi:hypothetical protein